MSSQGGLLRKNSNLKSFKNLIFERFGKIENVLFFKDFFNEFLKRKIWDFKWTETFKNEVLGPPQAEIFWLFWVSSFTKNTFLSAIWRHFLTKHPPKSSKISACGGPKWTRIFKIFKTQCFSNLRKERNKGGGLLREMTLILLMGHSKTCHP